MGLECVAEFNFTVYRGSVEAFDKEHSLSKSLGASFTLGALGCGIQLWVKQGMRLLCELSSYLTWENDRPCVGLVGHRERQGSISELEQGHWKRERNGGEVQMHI